MEALLEAAAAGDEATVDAMLESSADPNWTDESGWSPLIMAAKVRRAVIVAWWRAKLKVCCRNSQEGRLEMVDSLLRHRASPDPQRIAHSAIRGASLGGHVKVVRLLLLHKVGYCFVFVICQ